MNTTKIWRKCTLLFLSLIFSWNTFAVEHSFESLGLESPVVIAEMGGELTSSDFTQSGLYFHIGKNWSLHNQTIMNKVPDWGDWGWGNQPRYLLTFQANPATLQDSGARYQGHTVFRVNNEPYLGVVLTIKDVAESEVWIDNIAQNYCIMPTDCGYKHVANNSNVDLTFNTYLYFLTNSHADQSFDVETPRVFSGQINLGRATYRKKGCIISCSDYTDYVVFDVIFRYSITVAPKACRLDLANSNQVVDMGPISIAELDKQGVIQRGTPIDFNFECPKYANVTAYINMTDINNPSNNGDYLTLKNPNDPSTAKGVGIQLKDMTTDRFMQFSSSPGEVKQIGQTGNQQYFTYSLLPYYKKVGTIQPGNVEANAKITFMYQ